MQPRGDLIVAPCLAGLGGVGLQEDAHPQQLARRVLAGSDQRFQPSALLRTQHNDVLLDRTLSRRHRIDTPPNEWTSIRRRRSLSMTRGTRAVAANLEFHPVEASGACPSRALRESCATRVPPGYGTWCGNAGRR